MVDSKTCDAASSHKVLLEARKLVQNTVITLHGDPFYVLRPRKFARLSTVSSHHPTLFGKDCSYSKT